MALQHLNELQGIPSFPVLCAVHGLRGRERCFHCWNDVQVQALSRFGISLGAGVRMRPLKSCLDMRRQTQHTAANNITMKLDLQSVQAHIKFGF